MAFPDIIYTMKLKTAIELYQKGQISSGFAAKSVGGIDRYEFLDECNKCGVEPQTYENIEELLDEVEVLNGTSEDLQQ